MSSSNDDCDLLVLILATAIVTVQEQMFLPEAVIGQVVMEQGDYGVCALSNIVCLVNDVVDLYNHTEGIIQVNEQYKGILACIGAASQQNPKDTTFPGGQKVDGARLLGVVGDVNLKKRIVVVIVNLCLYSSVLVGRNRTSSECSTW